MVNPFSGQPSGKLFGMYLQDPSSPELNANYHLMLDGDYISWMGTSRLAVFDVDLYRRPVFHEIDWSTQPDLSFEHFNLSGSLLSSRFHQVNVFAVAAHTLDFVEKELGRIINWRSGGPLILRPHSFRGLNAFFDPGIGAINFGGCAAPGLSLWTCLSQDVVAHELGHAILDSLRPLYRFAPDLDTRAVAESLADLVSIFSVLEHRPVVERLSQQTGGNLAIPNLVSELGVAVSLGPVVKPMPLLRSAINSAPYSPWWPVDIHSRSTVWTSAIYEILFRLVDGQGATSTAEFNDAVVEASRWLRGMVLRSLHYMPPASINMRMLSRLLYEADARVFPRDNTFREVAKEVFKERNLWDERITFSAPDIGEEVRQASAVSPRALARVVVTHAEELGIPLGSGIRLLTPTLEMTRRQVDKIKDEKSSQAKVASLKEHYLTYSYEKSGSSWSPYSIARSVFGGGTLAFDENWNAVSLARS